MEISQLYQLYLQKRIVSTDSRVINPGTIFFALKGENFNGNKFAFQAIEKGAVVAVVDEDLHTGDNRIIRVPDVLKALQDLARQHRRESHIPVLALTGSNGKTTTKELCKAVLSVKFKVHATQGNLNNHIGVPLTLLSMPADTGIAVIEMGANHPGEIKSLSEIAEPDYGLITNIGKAHLEGFGGIEGVARAKGELFRFLMDHQKTIFLNEGNKYLPGLVPAEYENVIRYNGTSGIRVAGAESNPFLKLKVSDGQRTLDLFTNLAGKYNAENVLAAFAVGQFFGIKAGEIISAIESYVPQNNRSQIIKTAHNTVFMDAYNANPSSMSAAITEFLDLEGTRKLLIVGEMREVGEASDKEHREIIEILKTAGAREVICVGKAFEPFAVQAGYRFAASVIELISMMQKEPLNGYFIFVKGSRSNNLEKVIPLL
jgi:UDP-N-acetylmuramoyl-tripeptide--D-alanyl-D-alanine ligase